MYQRNTKSELMPQLCVCKPNKPWLAFSSIVHSSLEPLGPSNDLQVIHGEAVTNCSVFRVRHFLLRIQRILTPDFPKFTLPSIP